MSKRRNRKEVDAEDVPARHLNGYSNGADVRPISYPGCSFDGHKMPCNGIAHISTATMSSHSVETYRPAHRPSGRRLRPLAVLELILQKLKPNRRRRPPPDTESTVERQECVCNGSWQSRSSVVEAPSSKHAGVFIEDQSSYSVVSLAGTTSSCDTSSQCSHMYSMASSTNESYPGSGEISLTLAELLLSSSSVAKEEVDGSKLNNAAFGPNAGRLMLLCGGQDCVDTPTSCDISKGDKSSSVEFKQGSDQRNGVVSSETVIVGGGSLSPEGQPPSRWTLAQELNRLSHYGWYWGPVTREEAEEKLTDQPEGAFLVRDSTDDRYLFSLSFRSSGRTLHSRVEYCNGEFSFYAQPLSDSYRSMVDLIERCVQDSQSGVYCYSRGAAVPIGGGMQSYPVKLTRPVSRFSQVRSLQYLCRFVIRQHTRIDHIQNLPLPISMKGWLKENQY